MPEDAILGAISPFFISRELTAAVAFYVEKLGFDVRVLAPDGDPFFAIVGRDTAPVCLKVIADDVHPHPNHTRHEWAPWDAFVFSADPDALATEFGGRGVSFHRAIADHHDGLRGFEVADRDSYVLFSGCPV
jgi:catechol 2,3-dioxygenase-like lactoylglutathione lyase family enzyme